MVDPSLKSIKASVDEGTSFVEWLVEVLRGKNWVKKLLLIDVIILVVFNPLFFPKILGFITAKPLPPNYKVYFWLVVGLIFVAAVVVALCTKPKPPPRAYALDRRSAIKGLLSFTFNDADLFTRLQREDSLRECLQSITDDNFHFGILCGESGCGKSSFLQAGLWPRLMKLERRCVYVRFSDLDPLDSIRAAFTEQLKIAKAMTEGADFPKLLKVATGEDARPLILIFDQFEQFFVHYQREAERAPFVQALGAWHRGRHQLPIRILVSLRGDFYDHMIELQKAMGYSLGPQQSHRLKRFEPEEATEIFRVIAETEAMTFDEGFVHELTEKELASREDGLISPVDIQILAWMISGSKAGEERAFNRSTYQKFGGIEGLLEVFISRVLESREYESRRKAAINVMLALTDLERNVRVGTLTFEAIKERLAGTVSDAEIKDAVKWLGRSDVRLITSVKRNDDEGYELAHERLIPALRKIAGKSLSQADQANQLLDRRVNEWLGNNRASRYLLTWREKRLIERQKPYLIWGTQKAHKESLLAQTARRWRVRAAFGFIPLVITACFLIWWNSESGQLYQIKEDVVRYSQGSSEDDPRREVLKGLTYTGRFQQALQIAERIEAPTFKATALCILAEAALKAGDTKGASALLKEAQLNADKPEYPNFGGKTAALVALARTTAKMGDIQRASALLDLAQDNVATTLHVSEYIDRVIVVARAASKIGDAKRALAILEKAQQRVAKTDEYYVKAWKLSAISEAIAKTGDIQWALQVADSIEYPEPKYEALSNIARAAAKTGDIQQALKITEKIEFPTYKARGLSAIAEAALNKGDTHWALALLKQAQQNAESDRDSDPKHWTLIAIADVTAKIGDAQWTSALLDQVQKSVEIDDPSSYKNTRLVSIAQAAARTGDTQRALNIIDRLEDPDDRILPLIAVTEAAAQTGDTQRASVLLDQVLQRVVRIKNSNFKSAVLGIIAKTAGKIGNLSIGREAALFSRSDEDRASVLAYILIGWAERQGLVPEEKFLSYRYDDE